MKLDVVLVTFEDESAVDDDPDDGVTPSVHAAYDLPYGYKLADFERLFGASGSFSDEVGPVTVGNMENLPAEVFGSVKDYLHDVLGG
ncbi:MAG: hypothetical protein OXH89_05960, partial [bacterium]|nr:hypothetical protein [bacterium]